jgi:hypothetical protein
MTIIQYVHNPNYQIDYVGKEVLWVLSGEPALINRKGEWYDIHITNIPSSLNTSKPMFIDKGTFISNGTDYYPINNTRTEWQKVLVGNQVLSKLEKCVLLLFLDLYCQEEKRDLILYQKPLKFKGTNTILNHKDDSESIFILN